MKRTILPFALLGAFLCPSLASTQPLTQRPAAPVSAPLTRRAAAPIAQPRVVPPGWPPNCPWGDPNHCGLD